MLGTGSKSFTITSSFKLPTTLGGRDSRNPRAALICPREGRSQGSRQVDSRGSVCKDQACYTSSEAEMGAAVSPTPHFTGGEIEARRGKVWPEVQRELRKHPGLLAPCSSYSGKWGRELPTFLSTEPRLPGLGKGALLLTLGGSREQRDP